MILVIWKMFLKFFFKKVFNRTIFLLSFLNPVNLNKGLSVVIPHIHIGIAGGGRQVLPGCEAVVVLGVGPSVSVPSFVLSVTGTMLVRTPCASPKQYHNLASDAFELVSPCCAKCCSNKHCLNSLYPKPPPPPPPCS